MDVNLDKADFAEFMEDIVTATLNIANNNISVDYLKDNVADFVNKNLPIKSGFEISGADISMFTVDHNAAGRDGPASAKLVVRYSGRKSATFTVIDYCE